MDADIQAKGLNGVLFVELKKWRCHMNVAAPVLCSGGSISCGNVMLCELLLWTVTRKQQFVGKVQCCWLFGCMCRS